MPHKISTKRQDERVSVIIPAFNARKYVAEAIESARAQSSPPSEIVVVDDGSTDDTAEIVKSLSGVKYVWQANRGVAAALNHGSRVAQGDMIAFLSSDDVWSKDKLALQKRALGDVPGRLVFGHMLHFLSPELSPDETRTLVCPPDPMPAFSAGTMLARLDTFRAIGPLDEKFAVGEFMEWYGRAKDGGVEIVMLDDVVSQRRVHPGNQSTKALRQTSYAPVLKALLDRRRGLSRK